MEDMNPNRKAVILQRSAHGGDSRNKPPVAQRPAPMARSHVNGNLM